MINTVLIFFFFFNDTATTEIYTLSLHDALPISGRTRRYDREKPLNTILSDDKKKAIVKDNLKIREEYRAIKKAIPEDRKSTRLNSSHANISYAVFCLKKKK